MRGSRSCWFLFASGCVDFDRDGHRDDGCAGGAACYFVGHYFTDDDVHNTFDQHHDYYDDGVDYDQHD